MHVMELMCTDARIIMAIRNACAATVHVPKLALVTVHAALCARAHAHGAMRHGLPQRQCAACTCRMAAPHERASAWDVGSGGGKCTSSYSRPFLSRMFTFLCGGRISAKGKHGARCKVHALGWRSEAASLRHSPCMCVRGGRACGSWCVRACVRDLRNPPCFRPLPGTCPWGSIQTGPCHRLAGPGQRQRAFSAAERHTPRRAASAVRLHADVRPCKCRCVAPAGRMPLRARTMAAAGCEAVPPYALRAACSAVPDGERESGAVHRGPVSVKRNGMVQGGALGRRAHTQVGHCRRMCEARCALKEDWRRASGRRGLAGPGRLGESGVQGRGSGVRAPYTGTDDHVMGCCAGDIRGGPS